MPVTIDQVTADVVPPDRDGQQAPPAQPRPSAEADERRQRERLERYRSRLARVFAD
jgi:hypothetical protein